MAPKGRSCCSWPKVILLIVLLAIGGGVLLWQFAPGFEDSVRDIVNGTAVDPNDNDKENSDTSSTSPPTQAPDDSYKFNQCQSQDECCNGLDRLCDLRVDEVLWAMSHNAMSTREDGTLLLPNHRFSLESSLEDGYRGINLDVCNCGGEYTLCHGVCGIGTRDPVEVFSNMVDFLNRNENEMILVNLELNSDVGRPVILEDFAAQLANSVSGLSNMLYVSDDILQPWPTLGTMKNDGKRMLLFHFRGPVCDSVSPCPSGYHYWFASAVETPFDFSSPEEISNVDESCKLERGVGGTRAFFGVSTFTTFPDRSEAEVVNSKQFLQDRIFACSAINGGLDVNVMYVDFWNTGDLVEVVQEHNKRLIQLAERRHGLRHKTK